MGWRWSLLRRLHDVAPPSPRLLLSYSELDGLALARILVSQFNYQLGAHLGETSIGGHDEMACQIERAGENAVVVAIRTDRSSEDPTSAEELLAAKRAGAGLPADSDILPRRPELVDIVGGRVLGRLIVHPDPPLPDAEASLLRAADPAVRIATPTTLFGRVLLAQDPEPPLTCAAIAMSLSPAEDLPRVADGRIGSGITQEHLDDAVSSILLAALRSGARIAFGGDFHRSPYDRELRAGPPALRSAGRAVLNIDVDEPRPSSAGRVSCALYLVGGAPSTVDRRRADGDQVIAPRKDVSLSWAAWQALRQPVRDFDGSLRVGRMLWREILPEDIRAPLSDLGDRSLAVLGAGAASQLPWELLMEDREDATPLAGGIVRRLALAAWHRPAVLNPRRSVLRVLVAIDPVAIDPGESSREADAVAAAVSGRADVHVTWVTDGLTGVVNRLPKGCDVLHYVGQVSDANLALAERRLVSVERSWTPPGLVYVSMSRSARATDLGSPGPSALGPPAVAVARTVLRAGASAVIIALEVNEPSACRFAALAYAGLAAGQRLGHAVRDARRELFRARSVDWGNFLLFGDDDLIL